MLARPAAIGSLWLLALVAPASAQTAGQGSRWEIEGYGGVGLPPALSGGTTTLPLPGPPLTTSSPIFPTRQVPSWFFGDGATLLNEVNQDFGVSGRIVPLDAILGKDGVSHDATAAFGVRLRRRLMPHLSLEVSLDLLPGSQDFSDDVAQAVEAARSSFPVAFTSLLSSGPFNVAAVQATSAAETSSSRDLGVTGALQYQWAPDRALIPYVTFGAGILTSSGSPSASITGTYLFTILNQVPIQETDVATVRLDHHPAFTGVVGGGARKILSERWGLSFDARAWIGGGTTDILIDATPAITRGAPAGSIESLTQPSIQFSNDPSTGRQSSLGGALDGFKAYSGGVQTRVLVTVGIYRRF